MKFQVMKKVEINLAHVVVLAPVRFGDEKMAIDFPFRKGNYWEVKIELETGRIVGWPQGRVEDVHLKVCDSGTYNLLNYEGEIEGSVDLNYVPHGVVPGSYGDYIELEINEGGIITNWPKNICVSSFFDSEDD